MSVFVSKIVYRKDSAGKRWEKYSNFYIHAKRSTAVIVYHSVVSVVPFSPERLKFPPVLELLLQRHVNAIHGCCSSRHTRLYPVLSDVFFFGL